MAYQQIDIRPTGWSNCADAEQQPFTDGTARHVTLSEDSAMPLDAAVTPKTLTSTLHYLQRGTEKPARYRIEPPPGVPRWNGTDDPREVTIEDARGRAAEFTLDRN